MAQRIKHNILFLLNIKNESYAYSLKRCVVYVYPLVTYFAVKCLTMTWQTTQAKNNMLGQNSGGIKQ